MRRSEHLAPCYYYGCVGDIGHYLWGPGYSKPCGPSDWPFGTLGQPLDGEPNFAPLDKTQPTGPMRLTHIEGWTVLGMWDRSVDKRMGSHSTFTAKGDYDREQMIALAAEHFPRVWARIASGPID